MAKPLLATLLCCIFLAFPPVRTLRAEPAWGSLDFSLDPEGLESRLILGEGRERLVLGFGADGLGGCLEAGLEMPGLLLGPTSLGGLPAFLHGPSSESESEPASAPLDLDPGLGSTLSALAIDLVDGGSGLGGPLSLAVLARGGSLAGLAFLPGPGAEGGEGEAILPGEEGLAIGILSRLGAGREGPRLSLACFLLEGGQAPVEEAWRLEPRELGQAGLLGLSLSRSGSQGGGLIEGALSLGPFRPAGRAFRLEAHHSRGRLELALRAGLVSRHFAALLPSVDAKALALGLDAHVGLGRGARLSLALRASSPSFDAWIGPGILNCPDRLARLGLLIPAGVDSLVLVEPRLEFGLEDATPVIEGGLGLGLRGAELKGDLDIRARPRLGPDAEGEARPPRLGLSLSAGPSAALPARAAAARGGRPALLPRLDLALAWEGAGPPSLGLGLGLGFPGPGSASLELELGFEEFELSVLAPGLAPPALRFGLSYRKKLEGPVSPPRRSSRRILPGTAG